MPIAHATFTVERTYPKSPEVVFRAFSDPAKKRRWFVEGEGFITDSYDLDFRVGGTETSRFRMGDNTPMPGTPVANDTVFMDIVPDTRIVTAYTMAVNGARISCSLSTFTFEAVATGTRFTMTEQACFFDNADGVEMRKEGWTHLLDALAKEMAR